jgi:hypothetical protein
VKFFKQTLSLVLLAGALAAVPALQVEATALPAPAKDRSLVQQMRGTAEGGVRFVAEACSNDGDLLRRGDIAGGCRGVPCAARSRRSRLSRP